MPFYSLWCSNNTLLAFSNTDIKLVFTNNMNHQVQWDIQQNRKPANEIDRMYNKFSNLINLPMQWNPQQNLYISAKNKLTECRCNHINLHMQWDPWQILQLAQEINRMYNMHASLIVIEVAEGMTEKQDYIQHRFNQEAHYVGPWPHFPQNLLAKSIAIWFGHVALSSLVQ